MVIADSIAKEHVLFLSSLHNTAVLALRVRIRTHEPEIRNQASSGARDGTVLDTDAFWNTL